MQKTRAERWDKRDQRKLVPFCVSKIPCVLWLSVSRPNTFWGHLLWETRSDFEMTQQCDPRTPANTNSGCIFHPCHPDRLDHNLFSVPLNPCWFLGFMGRFKQSRETPAPVWNTDTNRKQNCQAKSTQGLFPYFLLMGYYSQGVEKKILWYDS